MSERPDDIDQIMRTLPARTGLYVPDDLLVLWFPPGIAAGVLDDRARKAAEEYGAQFNCRFWYFPERGAGCFAKNDTTSPTSN